MILNFPRLLIPYKRKNEAWRKKILDWADSKSFFNYELVRKSVINKKINYDLVNGILHMDDLERIINPEGLKASFIPKLIQHYPILNSKLQVLRGEEKSRVFDFKVVITNPNGITELRDKKKEEIMKLLELAILDSTSSDQEFQVKMLKLSDYAFHEYLDFREVRANYLLNHYVKELNFQLIFNDGFMDVLIGGEEVYQCDIECGEPVLRRLNPMKISMFRSGSSNKFEDADVLVLEDYWSPGQIIDRFYDSLSKKDIDKLEGKLNGGDDDVNSSYIDSMGNEDERFGFVNKRLIGDVFIDDEYFSSANGLFNDAEATSLLPYDMEGNVRVLRVYWKSRRMIKKVKRYNQETGDEEIEFYDEDYIIDENRGEEEEIFFINQAWEGTKIGKDIYVNIGPRPILYNRLTNPSICHFGIIGTIYNICDDKPYSLVDIMKPFNYLYDAVHDKLNKLIAHNYGKLVKLDLSMVPHDWEIDKWLYFAKTNNIAIVDSMQEGLVGAAKGKLAGSLNNNSNGVIDADFGSNIGLYIQLLELIKNDMGEVGGINRLREGLVANRETVGGVERATLQSSYITEWLFMKHDDTKKRVLECFIETAKIAMRSGNKKFEYILPDNSTCLVDIDGDEFSENDYGLVVDNGQETQMFKQNLETIIQAGLQNQLISFSTVLQMYKSSSMAEKQRVIELEERKRQQQQEQQMQQQQLLQQQQLEAEALAAEQERRFRDALNKRDNDTRIKVAELNADSYKNFLNGFNSEELLEQLAVLFDEKMKLEREKLQYELKKHAEELALKKKLSDEKLAQDKKLKEELLRILMKNKK